MELYERVWRETGGRFALFAKPTDGLERAHTTHMIGGLPPASRRPAQAVGFVLGVNPARLFRPIGETGNLRPFAELVGPSVYRWYVIVDHECAERALVVACQQALSLLELARLRSTALGAQF